MSFLPLQLRFNDIDQMGHVNNAVYLEFFDLGKEHFFTEADIDLYGQDFTLMIVHVEVDFRRQTHFNDRIGVITQVERIGNKSMTFVQKIVLLSENGTPLADEAPMAVCKTVLSGYLRSQGCSAVITDEVRKKFVSAQ